MANKTYITTRDMLYNTRRLKAGDEFRTSARDGDILVRLGRAQRVPASLAQSAQPAQTPVAQPQPDPLATARAEYEDVVGKRAFHGWDEAELRRRMAEHQNPPVVPVMPPIPVVQDES
jgi:hypothetical protein